MSRIGKQPIELPKGVEVTVNAQKVTLKGSKGTLYVDVDPELSVKKDDNAVVVERPSESIKHKSLHGLYRSLIGNAVIGVSEGYSKTLEIIGVGYRANLSGDILELQLGFSHPYFFVPPKDIKLEVDTKSGKNPRIIVSGVDKELVGQVSAKIRSLRPPEPYKGKGVRYLNEMVRRKAGKSAGK